MCTNSILLTTLFCWKNYIPQNLKIEVLTDYIRDKGFKKVMKVEVIKVEPWSCRNGALIRRRDTTAISLTCEDAVRRWPSAKPKKEPSPEPSHAGTLTLEF